MSRYQTRRLLPYRAEQLHALVLDIEHYPQFVPGYQSACIEQRGAGELEVQQSLGLGPAKVSFRSSAHYETPGLIAIQAQDGPFKRLEVEWRFRDVEQRCEVEFSVEYHLHGLLAPLLRGWLELTAPQLMEVFARRAAKIYGEAE